MKIHSIAFSFLIVPFLVCGIRTADCGLQKPEITRDEAIKLFTDANEKYAQAAMLIAAKNNDEAAQKLNESVSNYEAILGKGFRNGQIYYNLGNAYYRKGELGKAVLNYRKAHRLMPRNADLAANLRLAKNSIEDKELPNKIPVAIQRICFWFFLLNQNELAVLAVIVYVILMMLLLSLIILKYQWLKRIIIGFSAGLFIVLLSLGIKIYTEEGLQYGVIITKKCQVRYGPGEEYEPKFEIHNGSECLIEDAKDGWYKVYVFVGVKQDAASKTVTDDSAAKEVRMGWLQKEDVGLI